MNLFELLEQAQRTGDIIYRHGWSLGMRYCEDVNCFCWCDPYSGVFTRDYLTKPGYKKVILSTKLSSDEWILMPYKYEFRVGDYVETVDGLVGVIDDICSCSECKKRGFNEPHVKYVNGEEDYITSHQLRNLNKNFNRIGKYVFEK